MNHCILIAFDSTQQALRAEMLLEYADIEIDTRPTPKEITAGCALSIDIPFADFTIASRIIRDEKVEVKGYYHMVEGMYIPFAVQGEREREASEGE
ncbi:hypothetical protein AM501_04285 [Aneurinibacillus migulanus]|jgi:hypothetical protein|uniref:Putative Se/S carrier protein-like domain-containing protein n=1 Tax=Aneurinibacillus migulanus TaxID=47500 RepID=A0A0D1XVV3_ANEMI|nr:DUF3343 domain-containing protein [Aneurinibacillus migulanus]KIV51182.1 hypothetical protein TS64_24975 [Aneurinibacillus migulanus]KIV51355.1 hypothetical protein TS65_27680 [Aneurinibacillus migulanus]KON93169.1 hypothetical protein AF333_26275 [Aneurinibacillus migulanus]KPD09525.1 hypothetical protein AM501_04285 [Aneurinibacillus migulanus]MCP1356700.1 DUF3343 domain-containing protein [Aneurinibacillus migulanus]